MSAPRANARAFTLVELLVAVLVLSVVIVTTSKIFGTASQVTGLGRAGASVLQEAAAIEHRLRADVDRMSREGFLVIRAVAVRNDAMVAGGGPLLQPALSPDAWLRADQLVFFTQGVESSQVHRAGAGTIRKGQGAATRVYYGHAFQTPHGPPVDTAALPAAVHAIDPVPDLFGTPLTPWTVGTRDFVRTRYQAAASAAPGDYTVQGVVPGINVTQPPATRWLLTRQPVVLADDGGGASVYLANVTAGERGNRSTATIANDVVVQGRVDMAATGLGDLRAVVMADGDGDGLVDLGWDQQRSILGNAVFYPRAERHAPSMHRVDQTLTDHVLATACSSFIVEWTYDDDTGVTDNHAGLAMPRFDEQQWLGLDDDLVTGTPRGVASLGKYVSSLGPPAPPTIIPQHIDGATLTPAGQAILASAAPGRIVVYEAVFGYNGHEPLDPDGQPYVAGNPWNKAYTPWPAAIRVTMTLHDADGRLEQGREVQLVIDLPS